MRVTLWRGWMGNSEASSWKSRLVMFDYQRVYPIWNWDCRWYSMNVTGLFHLVITHKNDSAAPPKGVGPGFDHVWSMAQIKGPQLYFSEPITSRFHKHFNLVPMPNAQMLRKHYSCQLIGGDWNMAFIFPFKLGMSSSQLTNSIIFQRDRNQPPTSC